MQTQTTPRRKNRNIYLENEQDFSKLKFRVIDENETTYNYIINCSSLEDYVDASNLDELHSYLDNTVLEKYFINDFVDLRLTTSKDMYINVEVYNILSSSKSYFFSERYRYKYSHRTKKVSVERFSTLGVIDYNHCPETRDGKETLN